MATPHPQPDEAKGRQHEKRVAARRAPRRADVDTRQSDGGEAGGVPLGTHCLSGTKVTSRAVRCIFASCSGSRFDHTCSPRNSPHTMRRLGRANTRANALMARRRRRPCRSRRIANRSSAGPVQNRHCTRYRHRRCTDSGRRRRAVAQVAPAIGHLGVQAAEHRCRSPPQSQQQTRGAWRRRRRRRSTRQTSLPRHQSTQDRSSTGRLWCRRPPWPATPTQWAVASQ